MKPIVFLSFVSVLALAACGNEKSPGPAAGGGQPAPTATGKDPHAGEGHGAMTSLGSLKLGDLTVQVAVEGAVEAGKTPGVDVTFEKGKPMPGTVRAWFGVESAAGSVKAKLGKEGELVMHEHVEVPKPIPEGSKLWIEAELATGTVRGSVAFQK
jgi:hypothetical protein